MALALTPEFGIEIPDDVHYMDLKARVEAACRTIETLESHGFTADPNEQDHEVAATLVTAYAKDPIATSKALTTARLSDVTPAALVQTKAILNDFGHLVAEHAAELRNMVVNKLVLETENPDARIRIKALELLGKITDVGLFTDRKEITVTHQTADELREKLREKLQSLKKNVDGVYEVAGADEDSA